MVLSSPSTTPISLNIGTTLNITSSSGIEEFKDFELESGYTLPKAKCAYQTWGNLNKDGTNVLVLCHAMTGSADASDWWGPLLGPGRAFDTDVFFIFCANVIGSPYGSSSPLHLNPLTGNKYGPTFPIATIRDDVNLHKLVLDKLGVTQVQYAIGGSMGGMQVLEWSFFGSNYVKNIIPIATSGRISAWCISWNEAQRQTIYSDPNYNDGYYTIESPPGAGLGAARMQALLTYRSRNSFESRFGRTVMPAKSATNCQPSTLHHNEGNQKTLLTPNSSRPGSSTEDSNLTNSKSYINTQIDSRNNSTDVSTSGESTESETPVIFSAQSYLRYQSDKFIKRFDANCYINITRKMDTHDISRGRENEGNYFEILHKIKQPTLVMGIESDALFTIAEQQELSDNIPNSKLAIIDSHEGHDGFLIEFVLMNKLISEFIHENSPELYKNKIIQSAYQDDIKKSATENGKDFLNW